ncbi:MAG: hypothetical protein QM771_10575 [Nitrospira sp.]
MGKAQRILAELTHFTQEEVLLHGAVTSLTQIYREQGRSIVPTRLVSDAEGSPEGRLILAPPSAHRSPWMKPVSFRFYGICVRVDAVRGIRRRRATIAGSCCRTMQTGRAFSTRGWEESRATRLLVTHGSSDTLARYLREGKGMKAEALTTHFGEGED